MKLTATFKKYLPAFIAGVIGAAGGYLYYRFVGCASGTCAITSNPVVSTLYGGVMGGLIGSIFTPGACTCTGKNEKSDTE